MIHTSNGCAHGATVELLSLYDVGHIPYFDQTSTLTRDFWSRQELTSEPALPTIDEDPRGVRE